MDLRQLEYFVRVAEMASFTKAAAALGVAQPALSRQVRLLEVELRQTLLLRNGRGATPTDAGKLLLDHGRGILHQVERARDEMRRVRGGLMGRVAIGLPPTLARLLTVPLTRAFRQHMPQVQLSIMEGLSAAMVDGVTLGRLDLAVLYNAQAMADIELAPLFDEPLVLVQARQPGLLEDPPPLPVSLREVAHQPLVIPSRPNALRMHVETEMARQGLRPTIALEIDGVGAILDLVADGMGSAILSAHAVAGSVRPSAYVTRPIGHPPLLINVSLATSASRPTTPALQASAELIRRACSAWQSDDKVKGSRNDPIDAAPTR
jgi:LysR family nitrogen assimilation transcriptional regulator